MKSVGIRNLKNQLSRYIGEVRDGEVVLVTDHDEVVAQIIPPGPLWTAEASRERALLARLAAQGKARLGRRGPVARSRLAPLPPALARVDLARLLDDFRQDRG